MARKKKGETAEENVDLEEIDETPETPKKASVDHSEARKNYELAIAQVEKSFGKGSVMTIGARPDNIRFPHLSSGSIAVDIILGGGGVPFGRVIEVYGPESCGKTTFLLQLVARAQRLGIKCLFVDSEQSLNVDYAQKLGVDMDELDIAQNNSAEEALSMIETLAESGYIGLILLDSIAGLVPQSEKAKDMTENEKMAERARILSRYLPRLVSILRKSKCMLVCSNQLREGLNPYGPKETVPGGKAMKYYATQRLSMRMVEKISRGEEVIGQKVRIKTDKNKMNAPYKEAFFNIIFGKGIDSLADLVEVGSNVGVIEKSGSWYSYKGEKIGQGVDQVKMFLSENPDKYDTIYKDTLALVGPWWGAEGID